MHGRSHKSLLLETGTSSVLYFHTWANDDQGVDRHLFGLKKMLKQGEPIYAEPAFEQSSHGELNTSQLSISDGRVRV